MKYMLIAGFALFASVHAQPVLKDSSRIRMDQITPETLETKVNGVYVYYDINLNIELVTRLIMDHTDRFQPGERGIRRVYGFPGHDNLYLVAGYANIGGTGLDQYPIYRCILYAMERNELAPVDTTGHLWDASWLKPVFFQCAESLLILADYGYEEYWGIIGYELVGSRLIELPEILVTKPDYDSPLGWAASAMPHLQVFRTPTGYELEFDSDLLWYGGSTGRMLLCRKEEKIVVYQHNESYGKDWDFKGAECHEIDPARDIPRLCE